MFEPPENIDKSDYIKVLCQMSQPAEWKNKPQNEKKYLQHIEPKEDSHLEFVSKKILKIKRDSQTIQWKKYSWVWIGSLNQRLFELWINNLTDNDGNKN